MTLVKNQNLLQKVVFVIAVAFLMILHPLIVIIIVLIVGYIGHELCTHETTYDFIG